MICNGELQGICKAEQDFQNRVISAGVTASGTHSLSRLQDNLALVVVQAQPAHWLSRLAGLHNNPALAIVQVQPPHWEIKPCSVQLQVGAHLILVLSCSSAASSLPWCGEVPFADSTMETHRAKCCSHLLLACRCLLSTMGFQQVSCTPASL
jgi:hypothetical protein